MAVHTYKGIPPTIAASAYVDERAVVIGDVVIGEHSSIWPMCSVRGDVNFIRIGARTNIQDGSVVHVTRRSKELSDGYPVIIGDDVTIGHRAIIHGCIIESRCLIGMGSIILDDALVHSHVLLGAGSLVPQGKELEGGHLWLGAPAKKVRALTADENAWFEQSAKSYVELKNEYMR